jgi:Na+-driven multidrug efflux pump
VLLPVLLFLPHYLDLQGIWMAAPISDVAAAIICAIILVHEFKLINSKICSGSFG